MFENSHLVENFLNYWRSTGHQRIGYLYGKYEIHSDVPLGIRATVVAIYEPPQVGYHLHELSGLYCSYGCKITMFILIVCFWYRRVLVTV